jgi:hypothetical protein
MLNQRFGIGLMNKKYITVGVFFLKPFPTEQLLILYSKSRAAKRFDASNRWTRDAKWLSSALKCFLRIVAIRGV